MGFPVVMYRCERWTIKKAEHQRISDFELWCWRRLFPLGCKKIKAVNLKGNQSWIWKDWCWSWSSNILATWCEKVEKTLMLGDWRQEEKGATEDEMVGCITNLLDMSLSKLRGLVMDREARGCTVEHDWATELNWTNRIRQCPHSSHEHVSNLLQ